jgi:hypothetical protein
MLTLSRAGLAITCHLDGREHAEARRSVQRLRRSLRVTAASFALTLVTLLSAPCILSAQQPSISIRWSTWWATGTTAKPAGATVSGWSTSGSASWCRVAGNDGS